MNVAVINAGGTGQRMRNSGRPKQFLELYGKPIIAYTLEVFQSHPDIDVIAVACVEGWLDRLREIRDKFGLSKLTRIMPGGVTTQESKLLALRNLRDICKDDDAVVIHDAVRPLIDHKLIDDHLTCLRQFGNAIAVTPFTETGVVSEDGRTLDGTIDRSKLYIAKSPQTFFYGEALYAHEAAQEMPPSLTIDTCSIMSALGKKLYFVPCLSNNIKITTPEDYYIFKAIHDLHESNMVLGL